MAFDGAPPPSGGGFTTSPKTQEVLTLLRVQEKARQDGGDRIQVDESLLRALYEPALAVAAAITHVREGRVGMAPFVGAGGVVLAQALIPLIEHFSDQELSFEDAFNRIGIPVVAFSDLPDAPEVQTPATQEDTREDLGYREDEDPDVEREQTDAEAAAEDATW